MNAPVREIYTPAFVAAVREGKVWTVMSAYNQINGSFASANWYLQKQILKNEAGFDGILMTDWGGLHSTLAVNDGCDLENPGAALMAPGPLAKALKAGDIQQSSVDDAARRVIRTIIRVGLLDGPPHQPDHSLVNSPEHQKLAFEAAAKSIILLKNDRGVLPLDLHKIHSIALIGPTVKNWQFDSTPLAARGSRRFTPSLLMKASPMRQQFNRHPLRPRRGAVGRGAGLEKHAPAGPARARLGNTGGAGIWKVRLSLMANRCGHLLYLGCRLSAAARRSSI